MLWNRLLESSSGVAACLAWHLRPGSARALNLDTEGSVNFGDPQPTNRLEEVAHVHRTSALVPTRNEKQQEKSAAGPQALGATVDRGFGESRPALHLDYGNSYADGPFWPGRGHR